MSIHRALIIIISLLLLFFIASRIQRKQVLERFISYCDSYKDCKSCAGASGCSWCPKSKVCLNSTLLKSTDKDCNQMNTIASQFRCKSIADDEIPPKDVTFEEQYDFTLYKDKIENRIPPPNAYTSGKVDYSPADIVSNTNNVRNDVANLQIELPGIISSSVENQIRPMVRGILSENYYIQGFADYDKTETQMQVQTQKQQQSEKCRRQKTCHDCTSISECGWDPRTLRCDIQSANKTTNITQKQRCVLTPSTLNLMKTQPN